MKTAWIRHWLGRKSQQFRTIWPWETRRYRPIVELLEDRVVLSTVAEAEPNDALALATAFSVTQGPTGFFTSLGTGAIGTTSDVDYWRFDAVKGDRVSIAGDGGSGSNSAYVELRNGADSIIAQAGDSSGGHALISNFTIPNDGTYYVKVRTFNGSGVTLPSYSVR